MNDPTLYALLLCSLQLAILAYLRLDCLQLAPAQRSLLRGEQWLLAPKFLGYAAIVFFGIAYYLLLAKADLSYPPLAFQYFALALLTLGLAIIFNKITALARPFLAASLLAPVISLLHVANSGTLAQILALSFLLYLLVANYYRSGFLAVLAAIYLVLTPYSYLLHWGKGGAGAQ